MALAFLRRHQRWFHVLLGLVILGFIVLYIPIFRDAAMGSPAEEVGRVADRPITVREFQTAYRRLRNQYEQMSPGRVDARMLRMLGLDRQVFDGLVEQRVIELEAERLGIVVSNREIAEFVQSLPIFQENGAFVGGARVKMYVESQGQTMEEFERAVRQNLLRKHLEALVTDGVSVTAPEAEQDFKRSNEEIKAEYVLVDSARFESKVAAADEDVKAHFEANKETYRVPEMRVATYVAVDPMLLRTQTTVTDADAEGYYRDHPEEFQEKEQVCAQHILVKVKGEGETEGRTDEQAKKVATDVLAQLRAGGDFAALAKKHSEDTGSAVKGGDLDCFGRGAMVPEFENSAFNLEKGQISDLVKSTYGYHIIKVNEQRAERQKAIVEVKASIHEQLLSQRAQAKAEQQASAMSAALTRGDKLEAAAAANGLQVQTSEPIGRKTPGAQVFGENVVTRLFELKPGDVSPEPLAWRDGFVFVQLKEVKAPRLPELSEVQAQVKTDVVKKKALEQARTQAAELKAKAASSSLDKAASSMGLTRKETPSVVRRGDPLGDVPSGMALEEAAFSLPADTLSDPIPVANGYVVLRVREKKAFDPAAFEKEKGAIMARLRAQKRQDLFRAYLAQARQRLPVERRSDVLGQFTS